MRTSRVVPLGKAGLDEVTKVAGIPGEGRGLGALCTVAAEGAAMVGAGAGADSDWGAALTAWVTGWPLTASRRACG